MESRNKNAQNAHQSLSARRKGKQQSMRITTNNDDTTHSPMVTLHGRQRSHDQDPTTHPSTMKDQDSKVTSSPGLSPTQPDVLPLPQPYLPSNPTTSASETPQKPSGMEPLSTTDYIEDEGGGGGGVEGRGGGGRRGEIDAFKAFAECSVDPPVTLQSVAELETARILNNAGLRHDVNFDRELQFRRNTDGKRGRQKQRDSTEYWKAVVHELDEILRLQLKRASNLTEDEPLKQEITKVSTRVPRILFAVRDILKSLVPDAEQFRIADRLDVDFIMHQISNAVCNLIELVAWLARIIKTHCAPMRDIKVDEMEQTVARAVREQDMSTLADGLRQLIGIMEDMKLDVANHQIRHVRPLLVRNTIVFQQKYNTLRIKSGKLDARKSMEWLQKEICRIHNDILPPSALDAVCSKLLWNVISPQGERPFTDTFHLDFDRLSVLTSEMHSHIYVQLCRITLANLLVLYRGEYNRDSLSIAWDRVQAYLEEIVKTPDWFKDNIDNIAAQIAESMIPSNDERYDIIQEAESRLNAELSKDTDLFWLHKKLLFHRVLPKLQVSVHKHVGLSPLDLQDALVPQVTRSVGLASLNGQGAVLELANKPLKSTDPDEVFVHRLTHIIVLHWQVWADLLYLVDDHDFISTTTMTAATTTEEADHAQSISSDDREDSEYAPASRIIAQPSTPCSEVSMQLTSPNQESGMNEGSEKHTGSAEDP